MCQKLILAKILGKHPFHKVKVVGIYLRVGTLKGHLLNSFHDRVSGYLVFMVWYLRYGIYHIYQRYFQAIKDQERSKDSHIPN